MIGNSSPSDECLVRMILGGDQDAFTHLYERYRLRIYVIAFQIIRNFQDAEDATQEVFLKIFLYLDSWNYKRSKLSSWIYRVAINHAIDHCRIQHRRAEARLSKHDPDLIFQKYCAAKSAESPFIAIRNREEVNLIWCSIKKLPYLQRKAFIYRYFKDLKPVEIAKLENCHTDAVKSAIYRARNAVRQSLLKSRSIFLS